MNPSSPSNNPAGLLSSASFVNATLPEPSSLIMYAYFEILESSLASNIVLPGCSVTESIDAPVGRPRTSDCT